MNRLISAVLIICLAAKLQPLYGYKWVASKAGDPIPRNAVLAYESTYVGRARHVNLILPAEFEVLVADEQCTWVEANKLTEKIVRVGTAWNEEPIFITKLSDTVIAPSHIIPVLFSSGKFWTIANLLECEDNIKWVDYSSGAIPNNAIPGGLTDTFYKDVFVARLIGPSFFISGHIKAEYDGSGVATATYKGHKISSTYSQVLVGDTDEYSWKLVRNGEIPGNAVAAGFSKENGLIYVSSVNNRFLGSITFQDIIDKQNDYEVLVKNIK